MRRLRRLADASEFSDDSFSDDTTCYEENPKLEAFLTGKAVRSEINLNDLSAEDRAKFDQAMEKEWNSFKKFFSTVEILSESQIAALQQDAEIVNTRWVHTDKNQKPRLMAGAMRRRTGKFEAQIKKEYPSKPNPEWLSWTARRGTLALDLTLPLHHSCPSIF